MIFGVGVDIVQVDRMKKWVADEAMIRRFFNPSEMMAGDNGWGKDGVQGRLIEGRHITRLCEHYAVRFAAKEAFSKALGTGLWGFALRDAFIMKDADGKPALIVVDSAKEALEKRCAGAKVFVSLSHEKEYAVAFVVIER